MSRRARRACAWVMTILLLVVVFGIVACWVIAIWNPWGNGQQWGQTGAAGLFLAAVLGFGSLILWTGGKS